MRQKKNISDEKRARQKAASRRWYEKLKSDPERYLARAEKCEEYEKKHIRHIRAMRRKRDKRRYKKMMKDPVAHEIWLAKRRERYYEKMKNPEYREKLRKVAEKNYAARRKKLDENPEEREKFNESARLRNKARRDFLKSTPEGRTLLKRQHRRQYERIMADPERHERVKKTCRESMRRKRQTESYRIKKEEERKKREKALNKKKRMAEYRSRPEIKERQRRYAKEWAKKNPEKVKLNQRRANERRKKLRRTDPEWYAETRRKRRLRRMQNRIANGKPYKAMPQRCIPDYCVLGKELDRNSKWLRNNLTETQRRSADAFAREKRIEEREWLETNN